MPIAFFTSLGLGGGPTGVSIWATFAIMVYLTFVKTAPKLKVAVTVVYIFGWIIFFLQGDTVAAATVVLHAIILVYCLGHFFLALSTGDVG